MEGSWAQTETLEGYYRVNETAFTEYVTGIPPERGPQGQVQKLAAKKVYIELCDLALGGLLLVPSTPPPSSPPSPSLSPP